jgi:hypothetical protein
MSGPAQVAGFEIPSDSPAFLSILAIHVGGCGGSLRNQP